MPNSTLPIAPRIKIFAVSDHLPKPEIVFENERILVVHKPGGLLTQAPSGIDSMELRIKRFLASRDGIEGKVYLGVPHRLDRPASGVMVFAKNKKAARFLAEQFQRREVEKTYWAVIDTSDAAGLDDKGTWQDWMRKVPDEARSEICQPEDPGAQQAILHYQIGDPINDPRFPNCCWLSIKLETGRSHQIRLQSSTRKMPLVGDWLYGSAIAFGPNPEDQRLRWIALHARQLTFVDPKSKQPLTLQADVAEHWPVDLSSKKPTSDE